MAEASGWRAFTAEDTDQLNSIYNAGLATGVEKQPKEITASFAIGELILLLGACAVQGIDTEEIVATVHARRAPMMSATAGLQL
jgi:hypothetical protein